MKKAKLREQVVKLKALADGNANPHEAAAAREKVRELESILSSPGTRGVFEKIPGSGIFWIRFVDSEGKYRREKIGSYSAAVKLYHKRKTQADEGVKLPPTRKRSVPFSDLADDAIAYVKEEYARPADDVARLELLKKYFTGRADSITPKLIKSTLKTLTAAKRWSASSRNHHHNLVSLAFRLGMENEKVETNPARAVQRESETSSQRIRFLAPAEEKKLRDAIRSKSEWEEHEPELDLALSTGLRRGSMYLDLTWENVDLAARTLTIPRTKNGDPITLPLNGDAMRALQIFRSRGDGTGRVVRNSRGETLNVTAHWFPDAVRAAKIAPFRWHDCRHCFASKLRQAGVPLGNIAELLGHKGLAMTKRYAHLSISNLHDAVGRISNSTCIAPEPIRESQPESYVN
ncbi:MAG: tyrosine-type recombinase/integrase [Candidatus Acidiferrum sp.]